MSKFIGILSAVLGLLGFLIVGLMFGIFVAAQGHVGSGMTLVIFQFWGAILSMAGVALGIMAMWLGRGSNGAARKGGKMGIACGVLAMIALLIGINVL